MIETNNTGPHIPGCIKKMTNTERIFFRGPNDNVMMAARISGDIKETDLRRALESVRKMHPLLGAKVVFDENNIAWFSDDNVPPLPLKVVERVSDRQWFDELQIENRIPFEPEKGLLIRFVLVHSPEVSDLLIICNHSICDGMALANLVRDILVCHTDPAHRITVLNPPDIMKFLPKGNRMSLTKILTEIFVYGANQEWNKNPYYFSQEDYAALFRTFWEKKRIGAVLIEFDPTELTGLSETCRKYGVSIGSAVTAACIAAREEIVAPFTGNFQHVSVPFDLRRRTDPPIGDVFCLCVSSPRFSFGYDSKKAFWENAVSLHNEIHQIADKLDSSGINVPDFEPSLIDAFASFGMFANLVPEAYSQTETLKRFVQDTGNIAFILTENLEKTLSGTIPSNLGRLTIPVEYGSLKIERMVFLPAVSEINPLILGGVTIGGRTVFALTFTEPLDGNSPPLEPDMIRIRNSALEYLGFPEKVHEGAMK